MESSGKPKWTPLKPEYCVDILASDKGSNEFHGFQSVDVVSKDVNLADYDDVDREVALSKISF